MKKNCKFDLDRRVWSSSPVPNQTMRVLGTAYITVTFNYRLNASIFIVYIYNGIRLTHWFVCEIYKWHIGIKLRMYSAIVPSSYDHTTLWRPIELRSTNRHKHMLDSSLCWMTSPPNRPVLSLSHSFISLDHARWPFIIDSIKMLLKSSPVCSASTYADALRRSLFSCVTNRRWSTRSFWVRTRKQDEDHARSTGWVYICCRKIWVFLRCD